MGLSDECGDSDHPGLRIRRPTAARVFFFRYRARDGALREIKLGEFAPITLAEAPRKVLGRLKLERRKKWRHNCKSSRHERERDINAKPKSWRAIRSRNSSKIT
jgi:hypothetical protein